MTTGKSVQTCPALLGGNLHPWLVFPWLLILISFCYILHFFQISKFMVMSGFTASLKLSEKATDELVSKLQQFLWQSSPSQPPWQSVRQWRSIPTAQTSVLLITAKFSPGRSRHNLIHGTGIAPQVIYIPLSSPGLERDENREPH